MTEIKAANYQAGAGETITGNLGRGNDGKFSNAGNGGGAGQTAPGVNRAELRQVLGLDPKPKKGKAAGGAKGGGKGKPSDEQKAAEKQAKTDANRAKVAPSLGVSDDDSMSLSALAAGGEPGDTTDLEKKGLVERGGDGAARLTTSGNALNTAMNRGDLGAAKRVMSVAADRKAAKDTKATEKAAKDTEKQQKQAEKDRKAGKTPAPAQKEAASMTSIAEAAQAAITTWISRLTAAKAISEDRAESLEDAAAVLVGHLTGMDEELVDAALKAGRRNSQNDAGMLQTVHDLATKLGADCAPSSKAALKSLPAGMSYDQARDAIRKAISEKFSPVVETLMSGPTVEHDYYCYVAELYEDTAIYEGEDGDLCRITYAFTSDGLLLGEPVKVQRVTQYVPVVDTYELKTADGWVEVYNAGPDPVANPYAVKSLGNDRIGGYAVLFGDSTSTDLTGDYFTKSTDFWLNEIGPNRPMLYHHALETATKSDPVVGIWDTLRVDDLGVWAEGQLKRAHRYKKAVKQLVDAGALGLSSGSAPNLVLKSKRLAGATEITRWPILEVSLTPEPAEPRMTPVAALKSLYADAGLDLPAALADDTPTTPSNTEGAQVREDAQSVDDRARRLTVELDLLTL